MFEVLLSIVLDIFVFSVSLPFCFALLLISLLKLLAKCRSGKPSRKSCRLNLLLKLLGTITKAISAMVLTYLDFEALISQENCAEGASRSSTSNHDALLHIRLQPSKRCYAVVMTVLTAH